MLLLARGTLRNTLAGSKHSHDICTSKGFLHEAKQSADISQLALLYICVHFMPRLSPENLGTSSRPLSFWQWHYYTQYIEFLAGYMYAIAMLDLHVTHL
jgi:hypothetical protein